VGGIDLLFQPLYETSALADAVAIVNARRPLRLALGRNGSVWIDRGDAAYSHWAADAFIVFDKPTLWLAIFGHGAECEALVRLGAAFDADVELITPNANLLQWARSHGIAATALQRSILPATLAIDPWTALVLLFHDHDWEPPLLAQLLNTPAFFIGAMGSRATHEHRIAALRALDVSSRALSRLVAPLGVIASAREPTTLALSALARSPIRINGPDIEVNADSENLGMTCRKFGRGIGQCGA
jgi:xanthine dehydrogenase accessory factor